MVFRFNVRRTKALSWILNIGAILGISFLFLVIYKEKEEGEFTPKNPKIYRQMLERGIDKEQKSGPKEININDFSALWNAPISGIKKVDETPELENETVEIAEDPLSDLVEVMVILKSSDPAESRVRLFYPKLQESNEKPFTLDLWLKEGDALKPPYDAYPYDAKVEKIEDEKVIFSYRGESVALSPEMVPGSHGGASAVKSPGRKVSNIPNEVLEQFSEPQEETVEYKPDHFYLGTKDMKKFNDWETVLKDSPVVAIKNKRTGKTDLTLTSVPEDSMAAKRGFVKNDVLISINGVPVHTKASAINYFTEHPDDGVYVVEYRRSGRVMTKTFVAPPAE